MSRDARKKRKKISFENDSFFFVFTATFGADYQRFATVSSTHRFFFVVAKNERKKIRCYSNVMPATFACVKGMLIYISRERLGSRLDLSTSALFRWS